jgi:hypothetical protein
MCLYPELLRNPKYKANKKNGGVIPAVFDERTLYVPIGCNKCMECRKQKARDWKARLMEDIKEHKNGRFITLTFSNEAYRKIYNEIPQFQKRTKYKDGAKIEKEYHATGYTLDNEIATRALRLFLERWRKRYKKSLRHWLVTELGHNGTENIHMHGIVWQPKEWAGTWLEFMEEVEAKWTYGHVWKYKWEFNKKVNYVSEQTINYCVKYVMKQDEIHTAYNSIVLTSAGIGANYTSTYKTWEEQHIHRDKKGKWTLRTYTRKRLIPKKFGDYHNNKYKGKDTNETYRMRNGYKTSLPIYWRNKIYTEEEREKLWIHKLNEQKRYVNGAEIDISKDEKEYYEALETARRLNKKLGYGDNNKNWKRDKYEHERRRLMQLTRLGADYPKEWDKY